MSRKSRGQLRSWVSASEFLRTANSPVLQFENADDFDQLRRAFECEVSPQGFIEQMYLSDVAALTWEILRLRTCKKEVLNHAFRNKFLGIFRSECTEYPSSASGEFQFLSLEGPTVDEEKLERLEPLADRWCTDDQAKKQASELLDGYKFDDREIETSAIEGSRVQIEALDRMIATLEYRRDKALNSIAEYRYKFAAKIKKSIDSVIDGEAVEVPRLENKARKSAA